MTEKELIQQDLDENALKQEQEQLVNLERYHYLKKNGYILFETIVGSQAHGTSTPTSDIDRAFVYILPEDDILGMEYKEQLKIHKDYMGYEIRRFLELLKKANPTVLELLNSPADCVLTKHPAFDILLREKTKFVTRACENAFHGYAKQQRTKAEGLEKMMNWEAQRVTKKTPIDFCYIPQGYDSIPANYWLDQRKLDQKFCALTSVSHCRDLFAVFYDIEAHNCFSELIEIEEREANKSLRKDSGFTMGLGYKGIAFEDSNDIRLSNIPFEERKKSICQLSYNKDSYRKHCDDYKKYQEWLEKRNENRWVEIEGHGQKIDGKNMMHFMRLIMIGKEIAQGHGINIRRPDAEELLKIRRGEVSLQELFEKSDELLTEMKESFKTANLPGEVSRKYIHDLLVKIRKTFYHQQKGVMGFLETATFKSSIVDTEDANRFIVKAFGGRSELQHFIGSVIVDKMSEYQDSNFSDIKEGDIPTLLMAGIVYNSNKWPKAKQLTGDSFSRVGIQRFSILGWDRDRISVMAGADWQEPITFDIVMWQDTLAAINVTPASEWKDGIGAKELVEKIGFNLVKEEVKNGDQNF